MAELDPLDELMTWLMISDAPPEGWAERWRQGGRDPLVAAWDASGSPEAMFSALFVSEHPAFPAAKSAMSYEEGLTRLKPRVANAMRAQVPQPPLLADVLSRWQPKGALVKFEAALTVLGEPTQDPGGRRRGQPAGVPQDDWQSSG